MRYEGAGGAAEGAGRTQAEGPSAASSSADETATLLGHTQVNEQAMAESIQKWPLEQYGGKRYCIKRSF